MKAVIKFTIASCIAALVGCSGNGDVTKASGHFEDNSPAPQPSGDEPLDGVDSSEMISCNIKGEDGTICVEASPALYKNYKSFCKAMDGKEGNGCSSKSDKSCEIEGGYVHLSGEVAETSCREVEETFEELSSADLEDLLDDLLE